ncbi:MAG: hypothetical protein ACD_58C00074G0001 [uncultured bacterium]|nr:MAG: hypothetical protein ACD_58C00074G0001 [uncultured bacterium]
MKKKVNKFVYWTPRILSIIFILFLSLFSLDVFEGNYGFWGTVLALFMHNIPSIVLLIILIISWNKEIVGGIAFILAGLLYCAINIIGLIQSNPIEWYRLAWCVQIAIPAFFIGILFLMGWFQKKAINLN